MYQDTDTNIPLDKAWSYFIQIAKALLYLHTPEKGDSVIQCALGHGDVKPENSKFYFIFPGRTCG